MSALEKKIAEHSFACHQSMILGQACICGADEATKEYRNICEETHQAIEVISHGLMYPDDPAFRMAAKEYLDKYLKEEERRSHENKITTD